MPFWILTAVLREVKELAMGHTGPQWSGWDLSLGISSQTGTPNHHEAPPNQPSHED